MRAFIRGFAAPSGTPCPAYRTCAGGGDRHARGVTDAAQIAAPYHSKTPTNPTLARSIHRRLLYLVLPGVAAAPHLVCSERTPCVTGCQYPARGDLLKKGSPIAPGACSRLRGQTVGRPG